MFAGSGQGICQQGHWHRQGENIVQVQKPLGSQSEAWERWATGHELVGIAVLAMLEAARGEFRGPGPDKKGHEAGGTETCHHVNTHLPPNTCPCPNQTSALLWKFLDTDVAAAALALLPVCFPTPGAPPGPSSAPLQSQRKPRTLPLLLQSCLGHGVPPPPKSLVGIGVVSVGPTWLRALCLCP